MSPDATWFHLSNCFPFFLAISHHPKPNKPNKKGKQIVDFCWWKISQTTTCHVKKLYERWDVLHINCLAGFLPSTVFLQSSRSELDAGLHAAILHAGGVGKRFSGPYCLILGRFGNRIENHSDVFFDIIMDIFCRAMQIVVVSHEFFKDINLFQLIEQMSKKVDVEQQPVFDQSCFEPFFLGGRTCQ